VGYIGVFPGAAPSPPLPPLPWANKTMAVNRENATATKTYLIVFMTLLSALGMPSFSLQKIGFIAKDQVDLQS
jgi:hypothetical protein